VPEAHTQIREILVSCVPEDHPWFQRFAIVVQHRGTLEEPYLLKLCSSCPGSDLPEEPKVPGSYGDVWKEYHATELEAVFRAHELASQVTVDGYTATQALTSLIITSRGVWGPPSTDMD